MTVINPPKPPDDLGHILRSEGYLPRKPDRSIPWLERWSVPLGDITPELLERTLTVVSTKADGSNMSAPVARRRRNTLNTILRAAVRRGHLDVNPMDRTEWRTPTRDASVDVSTVPSFAEVCGVVRVAANIKGISSQYAALFALVGMAGLRPSEGLGLRWNDLQLPDSGWGLARVGGAVTSPGSKYSDSGEVRETKGLKHRAEGSVREVPLLPHLVTLLAEHRCQWPDGELLFQNGAGKVPTASNYGPVWTRLRQSQWPEPHPLSKTTV